MASTRDQQVSSARAAMPMRFEVAWCLPRRATTVPMARRLLDTALTLMGVSDDCRADIALAITEACANAVRHAHGATEYHIRVIADGDRCVMEIVDSGVGLDHLPHDGEAPDLSERGRGLRLMRACTDTVETGSAHPRGLTLRMSKTLTWSTDQPPWGSQAGTDPGRPSGSNEPPVVRG